MSHRFDPTALREYDIRGIVGQTLGPADATALGRSFATMIRRGGGSRVAVGRDGRLTSPLLADALVAGLAAGGVDVVRIGLGPSPMLYYAEQVLEVDAGIQVTGSHNPAEYNGFKLVAAGRSVFGAQIRALADMAAAGDWDTGAGRVTDHDVRADYVGRLLADFAGGTSRIGWDAGNGAAGPIVEQLVQLLPGEHHPLFTDVDGNFPNHHPDPTQAANLAQLQALVTDNRLDFGLAFDGDGDRIGAVDGQGRIVWGDQLLSILAQPVLAAHPGATVIADVKASQTLFDRIAQLGGNPVMWKTGHSHIKSKLRETGAPLAGEMSGHIFFADRWYGFDDALYAAIRLIEAIALSGRSLAELCDALPATCATPELRFPVDEARKFAIMDAVRARLAATPGATVDTTDGVRVTTDDGWWLLRASNTEGMLTARAESHDEAGRDRLRAAIDTQLAAAGVRPAVR